MDALAKVSLPLLAVLSSVVIPNFAISQNFVPKPPAPQLRNGYVPVTIIIDIAAARKKLQETPPNVPREGSVPPKQAGENPLQRNRQNGRIRQRFGGLRDRQPLRKILAAMKDGAVAEQLSKISDPINVGDDRWLSLNLQEIVFLGTDVDLLKREAVVRTAVRMAPVIVISKNKPAPLPLPKFAFGKEMPPPPPAGTPILFTLQIDPKAIEQQLPDDARKQLDQFGIDCGRIVFQEKKNAGGKYLKCSVPVTKPVAATLTVGFRPLIKNNVLTFLEPQCNVELATAPKKANGVFNTSVQKFVQEGIKTVVVEKLKNAKIDFGPHLKKLQNPRFGGDQRKVRVSISGLRFEDLGVGNNRIEVVFAGTISKDGIVIFAP